MQVSMKLVDWPQVGDRVQLKTGQQGVVKEHHHEHRAVLVHFGVLDHVERSRWVLLVDILEPEHVVTIDELIERGDAALVGRGGFAPS